jgi:hypothetical protein
LEKATEDNKYPELVIESDAAAMEENPQESNQEKDLEKPTQNAVDKKKKKIAVKKVVDKGNNSGK